MFFKKKNQSFSGKNKGNKSTSGLQVPKFSMDLSNCPATVLQLSTNCLQTVMRLFRN